MPCRSYTDRLSSARTKRRPQQMVRLGPSQLRHLHRSDCPVARTRARLRSDLRPQVELHRHPGQAMTRVAAFVRDWEPPRPRSRPRPDRWVTRRLCGGGRPRPGEAGRWDVESRATGLAAAPRSRGRAQSEQPHRRRTSIQWRMPGVEPRESSCRCPGTIQIEMLASTAGCQHPVVDDGVAVQ